jgi:hypothetical protein
MITLVEKKVRYEALVARGEYKDLVSMGSDSLKDLKEQLSLYGIKRYAIIDNFLDVTALKQIKPERMFVSPESEKEIIRLLELHDTTPEQLQILRNTVVEKLGDDNMDDWTRMSMITAVIDNLKYKKGMAV